MTMTIFLICMIPMTGCMGFVLCALLQAGAAADRRDRELFDEWQRNRDAKQEVIT